MAGGPILPISIGYDANARVFPGVHIGGTNVRQVVGSKVEASLGANAILYLLFVIPETLPSGTLKLVLLALANATSGDAKANPSSAAIARSEVNYDTATLTAEGVGTITWAASDNDQFKELKITLDGPTQPTAGQLMIVNVTFETSSWTLAQVSTWLAYLVYE